MTTESNIKEKINYEKEKCKNLEDKIRKLGGNFNVSLINLDANLQVIKDLLYEKKLIEKKEFELKYLKKVQFLLKGVLDLVKELKSRQGKKIIIPNTAVPPKNLKVVKN